MAIFTETQREALLREAGLLDEAGGWSPKKAVGMGASYAMTLPGEGISGDLKFGLSEFKGTAAAFVRAAKAGKAQQVRAEMMRLLAVISAVARETDGLEHIRQPLAKIIKANRPKYPWG